jgi:hypothetical protein
MNKFYKDKQPDVVKFGCHKQNFVKKYGPDDRFSNRSVKKVPHSAEGCNIGLTPES